MSNISATIDKFKSNSHHSPSAINVLRNAYLLLGITLIPTIIGAYVGSLFPIFNYAGGWGSILVFLAGIFGFIHVVHKNKNSVNGIFWLLFFTLFMGYFIGPSVGAVMGMENGFKIIASSIGGTAALFFILSGYARVTKHNFAKHSIAVSLTVGLVLAIIMSIINIAFLHMPAVALAISLVVLVICSLFIIYDTNNVIRGGENNYIIVAMSFYISLLNIFQSLLNLLSFFNSSD